MKRKLFCFCFVCFLFLELGFVTTRSFVTNSFFRQFIYIIKNSLIDHIGASSLDNNQKNETKNRREKADRQFFGDVFTSFFVAFSFFFRLFMLKA